VRTNYTEKGEKLLVKEFNSLQDIKKFAEFVSAELIRNHEEKLAVEVSTFSYNSYTTPSEYLGEFRIVLKRVLKERPTVLNEETKESILKAVETIDNAFNNV
jgi:hypothetical protein